MRGERRCIVLERVEELPEAGFGSFRFDENTGGRIKHESGKLKALGQIVDKRAKADALHDAAHMDVAPRDRVDFIRH